MTRSHTFPIIILSLLAVIADGFIKLLALQTFPEETETKGRMVELAVHKNTGIAFDLPLWLPLVIAFSIIVLVWLVIIAFQKQKTSPWTTLAVITIALGALGNLFDRIFFGFVIDYIIIPATGSAFNLSDLVIISGLILLLWSKRKNK